ncbi:GCN5-related N-acetyltransferas-like protein [Aureobasidium namibiae CBS 147.97]|uniref:GCN5-related N-acetyltransferas-like protein n=1 Tax=Aureobasidium namibiae CBS 147.97 TaxID=1043004 RepID=A0A074XKC5_9PEZI
MSNQPSISHATREDVPHILNLIRALADYEKALSSCHATEESLASTLCFAPSRGEPPSGSGYAKVLLIRTPDDSVAGMGLYFNNYSTWWAAPGVYLEDLFVLPEHRNKGYGKLLIGALAKEVKRIGGKRLEWCCLKWNKPSLDFYKMLGAEQMEDWVTLRADGDALDRLAGSAEKAAKVQIDGK